MNDNIKIALSVRTCDDALPVDREVLRKTKQLMTESGADYKSALKAVFRDDPALRRRYEAAHSREI